MIWKPVTIQGFEKCYKASSEGNIRNTRTKKVLKAWNNEQNYLRVCLSYRGKRSLQYVHRLVMMAFEPINNPHEMEVNHKDRIRQNNKLSNLEWMTHSENMAYKFEPFVPVEEDCPF